MNASTVALGAGIQVRYLARWGVWALAVIAAAYVGIALIVAGAGNLRYSTWESVAWSSQWLGLVGGIMAGSCAPVLVAHGLTRRTVAVASIAAMLATALALAAYVQLGYAVEWLGHRAAGLPYSLDDPHLFQQASQVHLILSEYTLMYAGFLVSGWLVVLGFYRFGGLRGTLAIPLAAVPALGSQSALAAGWSGPMADTTWAWVGTVDTAAALALALGIVAAGLAAMAALAHHLPLKTKTS